MEHTDDDHPSTAVDSADSEAERQAASDAYHAELASPREDMADVATHTPSPASGIMQSPSDGGRRCTLADSGLYIDSEGVCTRSLRTSSPARNQRVGNALVRVSGSPLRGVSCLPPMRTFDSASRWPSGAS
eukprot:7578701-Alexandrium_andersonii.AAC.1